MTRVLLTVLSCCCCLLFSNPVASLSSDGWALLSFHSNLEDDPSSALSSWNANDVDPCSWFGVGCENGRVTSVNLSGLSLKGILTPEFGQLTKLRDLILSGNELMGAIPFQLGVLENLEVLDLSSNKLSGEVPKDLGNISSLYRLHLGNNYFHGNLPAELGKLTNLNQLIIRRNRLSGTLLGDAVLTHSFLQWRVNEMGLCDLKHLEVADFADNYFEGDQPACLQHLPRSSFSLNCFSSKELSHQRPIKDCEKAHVSSISRRILLSQSQGTAGAPAQAVGNGSLIVSGGDESPIASPSLSPSPSPSHSPSHSPSPSPLHSSSALSNAAKPSPPKPSRPSEASGSRPGPLSGGHVQPLRPPVGPKSSSDVIFLVLFSSLVLLFAVTAVGLLCCYCRRGTAVRPWTVVSGEIKKGFLKGIPAFGRTELEAACEDFSNIIGVSRDIVLFKGTLDNGAEIAVTSIRKSAKSWSTNSELIFWRKVESLSQMKHENLLNLVGYCAEEKPFVRMLVFEYVPNGTVYEHLHNKESEHLDWETRVRIIVGVACALDNMHHGFEPPIVHTKLSSKSVFLSENYTAKVVDFGVWRGSDSESDLKATSSGEITIAAASDHEHLELSENLITPHRDTNIYEFGLFLLEMITGRSPNMDLIEWALDCISRWGEVSEIIDPALVSYDIKELEAIGEVVYDCLRIESSTNWLTMRKISSNLCSSLMPSPAIPRLSPLLWAELEILSQA